MVKNRQANSFTLPDDFCYNSDRMEKKDPVSYMIIGWAAILGGLVMLILAFLIILAGVGLLAGAGSRQVGLIWVIGGFKYLFLGVFLAVTGLGLISLKSWARYFMIMAAGMLFMIFKEAILNNIIYAVSFIDLILVILYLFKAELRNQFGNNRRVG